MSRSHDPEIVRVSPKGQATIPQSLRERFGIDAPGEVFIYESGGQIVVEPVPDLDDLHGIHDDSGHEPGAVLDRAKELDSADQRREADDEDATIARYQRSGSESDQAETESEQ